jgi:hypothetical protein
VVDDRDARARPVGQSRLEHVVAQVEPLDQAQEPPVAVHCESARDIAAVVGHDDGGGIGPGGKLDLDERVAR